MSAETVPDADPKRQGTVAETLVVDRYPPLTVVEDAIAEWHDARTTDWLLASPELRVLETSTVPPDTPVEIKAAQHWISSGPGRQRGRWYLKRQSHDRLVEADGVYLLAVYEAAGPIEAVVAIPAATVDQLLEERWTDTQAAWGQDQVAKLAWSQLLDPDTVGGEQ